MHSDFSTQGSATKTLGTGQIKCSQGKENYADKL